MTSLLDPLTPEQQHLLQVVYKPFGTNLRWPIFQYVEATLDNEDLDAVSVLATFPTVGPGRYGPVWYTGPIVPPQDSPVALTVAGLYHLLPETDTEIQQFLRVLRYLVTARDGFTPSPFEVRPVEVTSHAVMEDLQASKLIVLPDTPAMIYELLHHEPSLIGSSSSGEGAWKAEVHREVRRYRAVTTVEAYLERVMAQFAVATPTPTPLQPLPFSLPAAIDYLNAIWQAHFSAPLFGLPRALTAIKLSQPCATAEEFDSCLSALSDVLKYRRDDEPAPFQRLENGAKRLGGVGRERVLRAKDILKAVNHIRVGAQHGDAAAKAASAFNELGINYPPSNWGSAWETVQARTVEALNAIREEIQAAEAPDPQPAV
jgi:hypothetical protein